MTNPTGDAAKPLSEWSDEELRVKVAELCGWKTSSYEQEGLLVPTTGVDTALWIRPDGHRFDKFSTDPCYYLPNYPADLNAMHEAWKWYRWNKANQFFFLDYQRALWRVVTGREEQVPDIDYMHSMAMESVIHATARQRAEAFVSTLTGEQP